MMIVVCWQAWRGTRQEFEQRLPWCWTKEAASWISKELGWLVFHIAIWFWMLYCVDVGSAYWR